MKISKLTATAGAAAVVLLAVGGWLLFKPPGQGPLSSLSEGGQPLITDSADEVRPGEPHIATGYVVNSSHDAATLVSASLVPVTGLPAARLVHVAVDTNHNYAGTGKHWPPGVPIEPLPGAHLGHGQTGVVFAITGPRHGAFSAAGLKLTYRWHGSTYSVIAWSVSVACVQLHDSACQHALDTATNRTEKLAGTG
jgi:hypothetical protein